MKEYKRKSGEELRNICEGKAKERGKNFSFENAKFGRMKDEIEIFCHEKDIFGNEHGLFRRPLHSYLNGCGCPKCTKPHMNCTNREWIAKAEKVHGEGRYDYSLINYSGKYDDEGEFICHELDEFGKEHGIFKQRFLAHLNGSGCPKCGRTQKPTKESFVEKCEKIHGGKYTYDNFVYVDAHTKGWITCPIHGDFLQTPTSHISGCGCPKCKSSKLERKLELEFDSQNIYYERQSPYPGLGLQKVDFFLPQHHLYIECQGEEHYVPVKYTQKLTNEESVLQFEKRLEYDKRKYDTITKDGFDFIYYTEPSMFIRTDIDVVSGWYSDKKVFMNKFDVVEYIKTLPLFEFTKKESVVRQKRVNKRITRKPRRWTYELCKAEAEKYTSRSEFKSKDPGCYSTSLKNGWLNDFMEPTQRPTHYWDNKDNVIEAANQCSGVKNFSEKFSGAYNSARRNGWIRELFDNKNKPLGYWKKKENVINESKGCETPKQLKAKSPSAYDVAVRNGWLKELFGDKVVVRNKWTHDAVVEASSHCRTSKDFEKKYPGAYSAAKRNKWTKDLIYNRGLKDEII